MRGGGAGTLRSQESAGAGCVGCVSPAMCDVRGGSGGPPHYPACGCLFNHVGSPSKAKVMVSARRTRCRTACSGHTLCCVMSSLLMLIYFGMFLISHRHMN